MSGARENTAAAAIAALIASTRIKTAVLTASILLAGASLVGWGLGVGMVERGYQTLQNSELLAGLLEKSPTSFVSEKRMMQNPQDIELFVRYLNALAPAVNNLEVLPGRQIDSYAVIADAAWQTGIVLEDFTLDDSNEMQLIISACAPRADQIDRFINLLSQNEGFAELGAPVFFGEENLSIGQQFTITCVFSPLF